MSCKFVVVFFLIFFSEFVHNLPLPLGNIEDREAFLYDDFSLKLSPGLFSNDGSLPFAMKTETPSISWIETPPMEMEDFSSLFYPPSEARDVFVWDDLLFGLTDIELHIIDLTEMKPLLISKFGRFSNGKSVFVDNSGYCYISSDMGVHIVDVFNESTPETPKNVTYIPINDPHGLYVRDDFLYVCGYDGLSIFDVSDRANPNQTVYPDTFPSTRDIYVSEDHIAYVSYQYGLFIFSNEDPSSPQLIFQTTQFVGNFEIDPEEQRIIFVDHNNEDYDPGYSASGLHTMKIINQSSLASEYQTFGGGLEDMPKDIVKDATTEFVFVAKPSGMKVYMIDNEGTVPPMTVPSREWRELSGASEEFMPRRITMDKTSQFVILAARKNGFLFLDVSEVETVLHERYDTFVESIVDIHVDGDYAYLCFGSSGYIKIIDISDISSPKPISTLLMISNCASSKKHGELLYVAEGQYVRYIDVSDPHLPFIVGEVNFGSVCKDFDIKLSSDGVDVDFIICTQRINARFYEVSAKTLKNLYVSPIQLTSIVSDRFDGRKWFYIGSDYGLLVVTLTTTYNNPVEESRVFGDIEDGETGINHVSIDPNNYNFTFASGYNMNNNLNKSFLSVIDMTRPETPEIITTFETKKKKYFDKVGPVKITEIGDENNDDDFYYIMWGGKGFLNLISIEEDQKSVYNYWKSIDGEEYENNVLTLSIIDQKVLVGTDDSNNGFRILKFGGLQVKGNLFPSSSIYVEDICGVHNITVRAFDKTGSSNLTFQLTVLGRKEDGFLDTSTSCVFYCGDDTKNTLFLSNETSKVCNGGRGRCVRRSRENGTCECLEGYYGENCDIFECYGFLSNDTQNVCNGKGICILNDYSMDYYPIIPSHCNCSNNSLYYSGHDCWRYYCYGIVVNSSDVCSGHGTCDKLTRKCVPCDEFYFGEFCNETTCDGVLYNDTQNVCHGHGTCDIATRICNCVNSSYSGDFCGNWNCLDFSNDDRKHVCGGHGNCIDLHRCHCTSHIYGGSFCDRWSCHGFNQLDQNVCGGHGACLDQDKCFCFSGYTSEVMYGNCTEWTCGSHGRSDGNACSKRGNCVSSQICACRNNYEGDLCETWSCGYDHDSESTCSGHGKCTKPDKCDCSRGYGGKICQTNLLLPIILAPTMTLTGMVILIGILNIICCCCCLFCLISVMVCALSGIGCLQNIKASKYGKLRNFDVLMKEQELEDDVSIAHLRMNHSLFEINLDEVKIVELLGEGGSNSVVFKAKWNGQIVAFKCFKTRLICSSQIKFDEFEREVEVLASVSHPNIVRFFGASIKQPRIGIIMEYCDNGDLSQYLQNCIKESKTEQLREQQQEQPVPVLPLKTKITMLEETINAMVYLHSRNIIHRDLKLENVLVDKDLSCKLMDFGLSTIVDRMSQQKTTRIGTNLYMAPEVLNDNTYTEKCDVFSFGIFMYIFITEIFEPYGIKENIHIEIKVSSDPLFRPPIHKFDSLISTEKDSVLAFLRESMISCWKHSHLERPSFQDLSNLFRERMSTINNNEKEEEIRYKKIRVLVDEKVEFFEKDEEEEEEKKVRMVEQELKRLREEYQEMVLIINNNKNF